MDSNIIHVMTLLGLACTTLISATTEIFTSYTGQDGASFEVGTNATFNCTISPYIGSLTWKVNSVSVAECGFVLCVENTSNSEKYTFTPSISTGIFIFTIINVEHDDNGKVIECTNGSITDTVTLAVVVTDCGTVPSVDQGNVILNANNRTTFGGAASVTCDDGYEPKSVTITCQSSGAWQTPLCEIKDKTTPAAVATSHKKSTVDIILIIIIAVLGTLFLIQLLVMCYFQCKIHGIRNKAEGGDKKVPKRIGRTLLGSVPVLGLIPIYMTGKVFYRDVYQVTHKHPIKESSGVPSKSLSNKTYSDASWNTTETLSHEVDADHIELEHQKTNSTLESPSSNEHDGNVITNTDHNQLEPQVTGAITETKIKHRDTKLHTALVVVKRT